MDLLVGGVFVLESNAVIIDAAFENAENEVTVLVSEFDGHGYNNEVFFYT